MNPSFSNATVLVSGASSGIGEAVARAFASRGAVVYGLARTEPSLREAAARLPGIHWLRADLARPEDATRVVDELRRSVDRIDVLVNNAGVFLPASLADATDAGLGRQFDANVLGLVRLTREALPLLEAARGVVVNVSSAAAWKAAAGMSVYAATKAAVESLTRSWALELAPRGIRVNAIAPGPTATPAFGKTGLSAESLSELQRRLEASLPLGRVAQPDEIAHWIVRLAESDWMTGTVLAVDGGMSLA